MKHLSKEECDTKFDYENLVLEGGGIKATAFPSALKVLEERGILQKIIRFAGSSAGSIVAAMLAIGYTPDDIQKFLIETDFSILKDDSWGIFRDVQRIVREYGIYKGDALLKMVRKLIKTKTGNADLTFQELYKTTGRTLIITGTCVNRMSTIYFQHTDSKWSNFSIALAVRISCSIPAIFASVQTDSPYKKGGKLWWVDGGMLNNYPIWIFDDENFKSGRSIKSCKAGCKKPGPPKEGTKTIGIKLIASDETTDTSLFDGELTIGEYSPLQFWGTVINSMLIEIERSHIHAGYYERTICIPTGDISATDFGLSPENKQILIANGKKAAEDFFARLDRIQEKDVCDC